MILDLPPVISGSTKITPNITDFCIDKDYVFTPITVDFSSIVPTQGVIPGQYSGFEYYLPGDNIANPGRPLKTGETTVTFTPSASAYGGPISIFKRANCGIVNQNSNKISLPINFARNYDSNLMILSCGNNCISDTYNYGYVVKARFYAYKINCKYLWQSSSDNINFNDIINPSFPFPTDERYLDVYNVTETTYYRVLVSNNGICPPSYTNSVVLIVNDALGVKTFDETELIFYPNPTKDLLHIDLPNELSGKITDLAGKTLMTVSTKDIDVSSLSAGIYLLDIVSEDKHYVSKIVKE